ncbi:P-loop containing nucleoside triphosphate hydrolase protein [Mycena amicta]|nr:P-loop containing nucleoside triphosphate hydrolase protein [Mycena amicta]
MATKSDLPKKFTTPPLLPGLQRALMDLFGPEAVPTPIQALALKWVVEPWSSTKLEAETTVATDTAGTYKEILLAAETGSGKSIAYLLPMLQALKMSEGKTTSEHSLRRAYTPRALILAPTHELARQIASSAKMLVHAPDARLRVLCASRANVAARDPTLAGLGKQKTNASSMKTALALSFLQDGPGEFEVGEAGSGRAVNPVDVVVGTPMKVMEMVRGRGWDRDAELGKELSSSRDSTEKGPKLRRGRDSLPGVGTWRSNPELDLSAIEWVIVDEADVLYDADFQETTRLLLADISYARGREVPFTALPIGLIPQPPPTSSDAGKLVVAKKSDQSVITPLQYPFHFLLTSATIPNSLSTYMNAYHPGLMRLVSPNIHHLPKTVRTEYVNWTGGNKNADIERRLRQVWADDAAQGLGPGPDSLGPMSKVLVFCNRNVKVLDLGGYLEQKGIKNVQLSSRSDNRKRGNNNHLSGFLKPRPSLVSLAKTDAKDTPAETTINDPMHVPHVVITTSLLSRGLDFSPLIKHVFIIEEPRNMIDFLHRAGRTGRGGAKGTVVLFGKTKGRGSEKAREARKRVKALRA